MYNKNKFRKINDKKVLRKKGKRWVVMSAALLAMIGGGIAMSHTTHADAVNANSSNQQNTMQVLNAQPKATQAPQQSTNTTAPAQQSAPQSAAPAQQQANNTPATSAASQAPAPVQKSTVRQQPVQQHTQSAPQASANQSASAGKSVVSKNVAPSIGTTSASRNGRSAVSAQNGTQNSSNVKSHAQSLLHKNAQNSVRANTKGLASNVKNTLSRRHMTSAADHHFGSTDKKTNNIASNSASGSLSAFKNKRARLLTSIGSGANARIHITNGVPQVDGNAVVATPTTDGSGNNSNDRHNLGATEGTNVNGKKVQANGRNNNEDKSADPFESDPYNPIINVDFADVTKYDMPVGDSETIQAHSNDQLTVNNDGSVNINGKTIQAPKGYTIAPYTNDTYTSGTYTVLPRMLDKKTSTWSSEDYTIGVQPMSNQNGMSNANLGTIDAAEPSATTETSTANPSTSLLGGPNNFTASDGGDDGDGGADNNNNITPNGTTVNNNDRDHGFNYGYDDHDDDEFAALINNQDRDGQDMLNRMQASGENATSVLASEAADQASTSAQAVSVSEEGQDAATIQSMNESSEAQSLKNEIAEQSNESTLQSSYDNDMNQFRNNMNNQRANLNSADVNALNQLSQLTNLTSDQDNDVANQLQSAESNYLGQLAQAQNPAQWSAVNNDYLASLSRIISDAQTTNDNNRSTGANSAANGINGDTTEINSLIDGNSSLTNDQKNSLKNKFASEASNATTMASGNTTNSDIMTSIVNSLNADVDGITSEGSSNATSDSNAARSASDAQQASNNANVIAHRDSAINEIEQDPTLTQTMKSMYIAQVMNEAAKYLNGHASMSTPANGTTINPTNVNNATGQAMQPIPLNDSLQEAQMVGINNINVADANDKAFVLGNGAIANPMKPTMNANLDRLANNGIGLVRAAANVPTVVNDVAMVRNNMDRYAGNIAFGSGFAQDEIGNATTVPEAQAIGVMDLSNVDSSDKAFVAANPVLSAAQRMTMDQNLDTLANEGIANIHGAVTIPSVKQDLVTTQNQMARYSGNLRTYNYDAGNLSEYPTQYNASQKKYTHGLQHFDATEYQGEANLVAQYNNAFAHGYNLVQTPLLNEEAFSYGAKDAANGLEAYPGIKGLSTYQAGYTAYTSGFNDGRRNRRHANLTGYSLLYQNTYEAAFKSGNSYRLKRDLVRTKAYNFGYRTSRAHRLAVGNVYGHSAEYVRGYIKGLNDRLGHHPIYIMLGSNTMLHYSPEFTNRNAITMLNGGRRSNATELIVNGASVDRNGNVRYHVMAIGAGGMSIQRRINGWISADPSVARDTYYRASGVNSHTNKVLALKGCLLHSERGEWNRFDTVGRIHRGEVLHIRGIVHCGSITRFYVKPGEYFTANKNFVQWLRD